MIKSRKIRWGSCSTYGKERHVYRFLAGKAEGKRQLGRPCIDGSIILAWTLNK
jgi:hypothetical protein